MFSRLIGSRTAGIFGLVLLFGVNFQALATEAADDEALSEPGEAPTGPQPAVDLPGTGGGQWGPIELLGEVIQLGEYRRLFFCTGDSFVRGSLDMPVFVLHGRQPGPQLCAVAAVHGDELNGVEIVRHAVDEIDLDSLSGTFVGLPIVNMHGFRRGSRYMPDRRDLNRYFPGNFSGSNASRIAAMLFERVIRYCDVLIDFHTGSFHRANLPQVRVDFSDPAAVVLGRSFGSGLVLNSRGPEGSLRRAAGDAGIAALLYEAGQPMRFEATEIAHGIQGLHNVMARLGMIDAEMTSPETRLEFRRSRWIRAGAGGIFLTERNLGEVVATGDLLGTITDPITSQVAHVRASVSGWVVGMAMPQVVLPGFALFHVGVEEF